MGRLWRKIIVDTLWVAVGRRNLVRLGRLLSNEGRLDVTNKMASNGEMLVQAVALRHAASGRPALIFDVGANVGEWTLAMLNTAGTTRRETQIHSFEPCSGTFALFQRNIGPAAFADGRVVAVQSALSNANGTALLNVVADGLGTNSLHADSAGKHSHPETIQLATLDSYCRDTDIGHILLVKIDTEGHDMNVLHGAAEMLGAGRIDMLQFEYNHRWVFSRHFLRDAFEFMKPLGYEIGKVTPKGIEFYAGWHPELETFREGNYLACRKEWVERFPRVRWWNE